MHDTERAVHVRIRQPTRTAKMIFRFAKQVLSIEDLREVRKVLRKRAVVNSSADWILNAHERMG
ncbi:hypothetical protein [Gluconobacter thailandicus]|uniref:hypothetical protein n=1 Tax=Gluconobacter thailandicus TaxID=257438 RepID=UPI001431B795|nr:hypothetical protein [Gluconobacter thailandicus]